MKQELVRGVPLHMPGAGGALKNRMGGFILVGVRFGLPAVTRRGCRMARVGVRAGMIFRQAYW